MGSPESVSRVAQRAEELRYDSLWTIDPPIYLAAFAPAALKRVATMADGWNPVAIPVDGMVKMSGAIKQMAKDADRDPSSLQMIVRANMEITDKALGEDRIIFSGTLDQIKKDVAACERIGPHELIFDVTLRPINGSVAATDG